MIFESKNLSAGVWGASLYDALKKLKNLEQKQSSRRSAGEETEPVSTQIQSLQEACADILKLTTSDVDGNGGGDVKALQARLQKVRDLVTNEMQTKLGELESQHLSAEPQYDAGRRLAIVRKDDLRRNWEASRGKSGLLLLQPVYAQRLVLERRSYRLLRHKKGAGYNVAKELLKLFNEEDTLLSGNVVNEGITLIDVRRFEHRWAFKLACNDPRMCILDYATAEECRQIFNEMIWPGVLKQA